MEDIQLRDIRDIVIIAKTVLWILPVIMFLMTTLTGMYLFERRKSDKKQDTINEVTSETLVELKIITKVHEVEIDNLKEKIFTVNYTK